MKLYLTLFAQNSTRIELRALAAHTAVNELTYVNDATVVCTIVDADGEEIAGQSWPKTLAYESGSSGNYSGVIDEALDVAAGDLITAKITATSGTDQGYWEVPVEVVTRTHRAESSLWP